MDFQLANESFGRSSINHRDTMFLLQEEDDPLGELRQSFLNEDRVIPGDLYVDFNLSMQSIGIKVKLS